MNLAVIKKNLNKKVLYRDKPYILKACILRKNDNGFFYQAELLDMNRNSLIICKLEDVHEYAKSQD